MVIHEGPLGGEGKSKRLPPPPGKPKTFFRYMGSIFATFSPYGEEGGPFSPRGGGGGGVYATFSLFLFLTKSQVVSML